MPPEIEEEEEEESGGWMTTFADLMSLLLTFFILLLSFANMDVIKFKDAQGSLKDAFGIQFDDTIKGEQKTTAASIIELSHITKDSIIDFDLEARKAQAARQSVVNSRMKANENIYKRLQAIVRDQNLGDQVIVENTSKGVVITVNGQLFFQSGSAILRKESFPLLDSITGIIEEFPYKLNIEGHTDNTLIKTSQFPSNWELSAGRAISAVRYILLSGQIDAEKLGASGYAETRPIAQNDTAEGRRINRRIEFVFFREEMEIKEFTDFQREEDEAEGDDIEGDGGEEIEDPQDLTAEGADIPSKEKAQDAATDDTTGAKTEAQPGEAKTPEELKPEELKPEKLKKDIEEGASSDSDGVSTAEPSTPDGVAAETPVKADETMPAQKPAQSEAVKKGILKPINILSPLMITPESIERPTTDESLPPIPAKTTPPVKTSPKKRSTPPASTEAVTTPPAKAEPAVPGKFSAPTD